MGKHWKTMVYCTLIIEICSKSLHRYYFVSILGQNHTGNINNHLLLPIEGILVVQVELRVHLMK